MRRDAVAALVVVIGGAFALRVRPFFDLDWWWHVEMGEAVLREASRAVPEPVAFHGPAAYTDPEWLFDVLAVAVQAVGGTTAATLLTATCAALSAWLVYLAAREAGADDRGGVLVSALAAVAAGFRFHPRPQSLFLVLLPLAIWLALRVRRRSGRDRSIGLTGLHLTLLAWSQCHTSVVIAPFVAWALLSPSWGGPRLSSRVRAGVALLGVYPFVGAFGLGVIDQVLRHSAGDATRYITDMRPLAPVELLAVWQPRVALVQPSLLVLEALLLVGASGAMRRRGAPAGSALLVALGLALTLTAHRFRAAWAILSVPFVAASRETTRPASMWAGVALLPLLLVHEGSGLGLGVDRSYVAEELADALEAHDVTGRLYAEYADGGYLGWRLAPEVRLFVDGRTPTHFDADDLFAARRSVRDLSVLERLDAAWGFDAIAVERARPVCGPLAASGRWVPVWKGSKRVLFLRRGEAVADPCRPPVDGTPRPTPAGEERAEAWAAALDAGHTGRVRAEAEAVLERLGHEAAPVVRLRLAQACAAQGDAACVGSQAWRAALEGEPGAAELLAVWEARLPARQRGRVEALRTGQVVAERARTD